ncbi:Uncharacterized protein BM_BM5346 [Brugia malayi]|uniref:Bm5346 n=1 Tax=Brugia malayi TaxID=6279 RepID=A0A4E9EXM3_BRUMA|nr:Uncharacterized protein BM_BM5346 [Brugia malayi]VIO89203.1 Uncharacterized protein BM_BM5346 [Brugia malayi]
MPRSSLRQKSCKGNKNANNFPTKITVTVILKKPFGLRINKGDLRNARVTLERCGFSCCKHVITTVETLTVDKGSSLKVLRAVEVYMVQIRIESFPDMDLTQELGLSVKYNNKEQLQVASVIPGSLASVHLRPGDIIKEVNGEYITSKTMLAFWIRHGFDTKRQIQILVQAGVEDDTHIEMPEDVQQIAQKQLTILRSKKLPKSMISLMKQTNSSTGKHIRISMEEPKEMGICSDYDETTLRHVHKNK